MAVKDPLKVTKPEDVAEGSVLSKQMCLRFVIENPIAFREHFTPQVSKRRFWHRFNFTPILLCQNDGDTFFAAGRGAGKSFAVEEPELARHAIMRRGEETLLTSLRAIHIRDRMERVIEYFEGVPMFRTLLQRITRAPYVVELHTGHKIYGISVGDDPEAKMAQGKHASLIMVEEAHQYPDRAYMKLEGAKDPQGCRVLMAGVPDGRLETPFRKADSVAEAFIGRRVHLSRRHDPYFDRETLKKLIDLHKGEDADTFKQEVDAEWGAPSWSAWDIDRLQQCMSRTIPTEVHTFSGTGFRILKNEGWTAEAQCRNLPLPPREGLDIIVAGDIGYSQPTVIGIFSHWQDRWTMFCRVNLENRMEHDDQALFFQELARRYRARKIAIDATDGMGKAICKEIQDSKYGPILVRVTFNEQLLTGYTQPESRDEEPKEIWELTRDVGTQQVRQLIGAKGIALPMDEEIVRDFSSEKELKTQEGKLRVVTPEDVHITDMMRVFGVSLFLETPPMLPTEEAEWVDPEIGGSGVWREVASEVF